MLEQFAGADVWRAGIRDYIARHAYRNSRTEDLWAAMERAGATGLATIARDFTGQPGIPLIQAGAAQCVGGQTVATLTQTQFSADRRQQVASRPQSWHVPVRATAGGAAAQVVTSGRTSNITVPGCGPLLINPGQTGYFRTLYTPEEARALQGAFASLRPVDQFGILADQLALSGAGYQPMAVALGFLGEVPVGANGKLVQQAVGNWSRLYDDVSGDAASQAAIASRVTRIYGPRLDQLGFVPRAGETPTDRVLRPALITTLGKMRDPRVLAEANRLFAAWQSDPGAILGSLKATWLGVIARNADEATWNVIHARAKATTGAVERTSLYQLLGAASDEKLARRALELALTKEPGSTVSAGIISTVAQQHPRLAFDFVLAHLAQVNELIDISGRSRFMQRLVAASNDPTLIPALERYAATNLSATDRAPVNQTIDRIRAESARLPRIRSEVADWLKSHPADARGERG